MAVCDKWVVLKIVEFLVCVACLVAKRVSQDDETRLALLLQKLSREWSLLTSVTWDSVGGAFADAVYGGYVIITFGLILARVFQEIPKGRRLLEGFFLGLGMLFFLVLGGLELASLDSVPNSLVVNASVLGSLSLVVAALFLIDLMGPRIYTATHHSQTDLTHSKADLIQSKTDLIHSKTDNVHSQTDLPSPKAEKKVSIAPTQPVNGLVTSEKPLQNSDRKQNGTQIAAERPKDLDLEKGSIDKTPKKDETSLFDQPKHGYTKFDDDSYEEELEKSKYGSLRGDIEAGNYIRLSDPLTELHYDTELAKFNEWYYKKYLESIEGKLLVKEAYLPELQSPVFAKVKSSRLASLYDDLSPTYTPKGLAKSPARAKIIPSPTLQQLEDYLKGSKSKRADTPALFPMEPIEEKEGTDVEGRASGTPTDPGYVQYAAGKWPEKRELRTPRHSPT